MGEHALISPSAAHRWLHCTPSIRLSEQFGNTESTYAAEGTLAHNIAELTLKQHFKHISPIIAAEGGTRPGLISLRRHELYNAELQKRVDEYVSFVIETYNAYLHEDPNTKIYIECQFNLGHIIPGGFGTGDTVIVSGSTICLIDLKMGRGVPVDAEWNPQQMLYAKGAVDAFGKHTWLDNVRIVIYQPRIDNINEWEISVDQLDAWIENKAIPAAQKAFEGVGEYQAGDHCKFCPAKSVCRANADYNLEVVKETFMDVEKLSDEEISMILLREKNIQSWLKAVKEYALSQALTGKKWPAMKLVKGVSRRKYINEEDIKELLLLKGYKEDQFSTTELISITDMQTLLGKNTFNSLLADHVVKPEGAPTLVSWEDKRPEYNSLEDVAATFTQFTDDY